MATMKSTNKWIYDAHASVLFKAAGAAAVTATGYANVLALGPLTTAYWDNNEQPNRELTIAAVVTASDATSADETYKLTVEVATDNVFTTPFEVAEVVVPRGATGGFTLIVDLDSVQKLGVMQYIRVKHTLGGTTPSLTYCAWMVEADSH